MHIIFRCEERFICALEMSEKINLAPHVGHYVRLYDGDYQVVGVFWDFTKDEAGETTADNGSIHPILIIQCQSYNLGIS
ncbi:hypothetical protein EON83_10865 [bacterium]|nr:MAG: hypothetical protein EON83_10865 [bacterium]